MFRDRHSHFRKYQARPDGLWPGEPPRRCAGPALSTFFSESGILTGAEEPSRAGTSTPARSSPTRSLRDGASSATRGQILLMSKASFSKDQVLFFKLDGSPVLIHVMTGHSAAAVMAALASMWGVQASASSVCQHGTILRTHWSVCVSCCISINDLVRAVPS